MSALTARLRAALALVVLAAMLLSTGMAAAEDDRYIVDDRGRPMRVTFPLHDRVTVDAFGAYQGDMATGLRLTIQHSFAVTYPDDEVWWRFRHRWLAARATRDSDGTQWGMTLLSATYMRHATSSYIVVPSANNARLPTPFDLAFEYDIFDATFDIATRQFNSVNVAEFAFLLDFLRDSTYRHRLAIGPVMAYRIDRLEGTDGTARLAHNFIPASGGRLVYRWESTPGRTAVDARLQCAATAILVDRDMAWHRRCGAQLHAERTVLAIADRPLNLFVEGALEESRWSATVGLRVSLPGSSLPSPTL